MSPSARLIAYYIGDNGGVVADSVLLEVEDSLPTKVAMMNIQDSLNRHYWLVKVNYSIGCLLLELLLTDLGCSHFNSKTCSAPLVFA